MNNKIVFPSKGRWEVKNEGEEESLSVFDDKNEAVNYAYKLASKEGSGVIIISENGEVENIKSHELENYLSKKL